MSRQKSVRSDWKNRILLDCCFWGLSMAETFPEVSPERAAVFVRYNGSRVFSCVGWGMSQEFFHTVSLSMEEQMAGDLWTARTLLEVSNGYWQTCTLHTAVKLDLFSYLDEQSVSTAELAKKVGVDQAALDRLLNALTAMQLLAKNGERHGCTPIAAAFLSRHSPRYLGHIILHHRQMMEFWMHLDEAVESGRSVRKKPFCAEKESLESFLLGMSALAMLLAPEVVDKVDLSGRRRLLDLGGGPGTWALHFCRENPGLGATVYDLPTTREFAEEAIARFGLGDRVAFVSGNFLTEGIPGRYDVAWLSHILHGEGPRDMHAILDKAVSTLEPGGLLLIHEFVLDNDLAGPLFPALFSLNMLLATPNGRTYSARQFFDALRTAGCKDPRILAKDLPGGSSVIAAIV